MAPAPAGFCFCNVVFERYIRPAVRHGRDRAIAIRSAIHSGARPTRDSRTGPEVNFNQKPAHTNALCSFSVSRSTSMISL